MTLCRLEISEMLAGGYFPPGLRLKNGRTVYEVKGETLHRQEPVQLGGA
jgi:hypothetical protein